MKKERKQRNKEAKKLKVINSKSLDLPSLGVTGLDQSMKPDK